MVTIRVPSTIRAQRIETFMLATTVAVLVAVTAVNAVTHGTGGRGMPQLASWQVSAFAELGDADRAIHSALSVAAEEIGQLNYDFGDWAPPEELDELLILPFHKDEFWVENGEVRWWLLSAADFVRGGDTGYMGVGGRIPGQSAYLLIFRHRHIGSSYSNQTEVWLHPAANAPRPDGTRAESLAQAGWKQAVAYRGADEVARVKND
jgi:hypothetical protein